MQIKYYIDINEVIIHNSIKKIINQIYKLLPMREEGLQWEKPLHTVLEELAGMNRLFVDQQDFFPLICKLEGLFTLTKDEDFMVYRGTIFQCLGLLNKIDKNVGIR